MEINTNKILFNAAGLFIGLFAAGYAINDTFSVKRTSACAARYPISTLYSMRNASGGLLSAIELQAKAGDREYGVLAHAKVVGIVGGPAEEALEVSIPKGEAKVARGGDGKSGIGMQWQPDGVRSGDSACLGYSVFLPTDFEYGEGGILPGLYGGSRFDGYDRGDGRDGFASRSMWRENGVGEIHIQLGKMGDRGGTTIGKDKFQLPRGRWVAIEQELVLNTPKKADGKLRVWIDGELKIENDHMQWREHETTRIEGVAANVGFGTVERPGAAPGAVKLRVAPFELRSM